MVSYGSTLFVQSDISWQPWSGEDNSVQETEISWLQEGEQYQTDRQSEPDTMCAGLHPPPISESAGKITCTLIDVPVY